MGNAGLTPQQAQQLLLDEDGGESFARCMLLGECDVGSGALANFGVSGPWALLSRFGSSPQELMDALRPDYSPIIDCMFLGTS